MPERLNSLY